MGWEQVKWVCYVRDFPAGAADQANPERLVRKRFSSAAANSRLLDAADSDRRRRAWKGWRPTTAVWLRAPGCC